LSHTDAAKGLYGAADGSKSPLTAKSSPPPEGMSRLTLGSHILLTMLIKDSALEMHMSRMVCRSALLLILSVAVIRPVLAQDRNQPPSTEEIRTLTLPPLTEETHAWDPLLGKWNFSQQIHNPEVNLKGTWTFSRMGDGFMIFDEYRTDNGAGGTLFLGETYRAYNPDKKIWTFEATQYVAPNKMGLKDGEWDAGTTRFENGDIIDEIPKGTEISRYRFYNIKRDSFSVVGEKSKDDGKTWSNIADIECMRAQQ
jgi:hypothetical protein